jgi:tol-pal system protein YbgF
LIAMRTFIARAGGAIGLAVALLVLPAHAALFDDDEARRAILELRAKVDKLEQDQRAQIAALNEQLVQFKRSVLELNSTIEQLRAEVARMRGQDEQIARDVAELQRRQKDVAAGVEDRIRKLEPVKVSIDGQEFLADPEEKRQFDDALALFRGSEFDKAIAAIVAFQRRFPGSGYRESALFWLGNAQYAKRDYKEAINSFRALVSSAPEHPKSPEALLAIANCQIELKDRPAARRTLGELMKAYPGTEAAEAGRERLAAIRG